MLGADRESRFPPRTPIIRLCCRLTYGQPSHQYVGRLRM